MPVDLVNPIEFSREEIKEIEKAFKILEKNLISKMINLTPEERRKSGRPKQSLKIWTKKILMYMEHAPEMTPYYIREEKLRNYVELIETLEKFEKKQIILQEGISDTLVWIRKIIHELCFLYYGAIKEASKADVPGITTVYHDLKQQFGSKKSEALRGN